MTGWRLGYACAPKEVMEQMLKIHQYAIMCAPTTSQYAAIKALRDCEENVIQMREEYDMRRRFIVDGFNSLGLHCFEPRGAFYIFPVSYTHLGKENSPAVRETGPIAALSGAQLRLN